MPWILNTPRPELLPYTRKDVPTRASVGSGMSVVGRGRSRATLRRVYINIKDREIIGIQSARLEHMTTTSRAGELTETTFDTSTYADGAVILLTNETGGNITIKDCSVFGKLVVRLSGEEGWLHDSFVDYESIRINGEIRFEMQNNFIVQKEQVEKLADYHWKLNRGRKHIYTITRCGRWFHVTPGEWYTLSIGGAGQKEYISATVMCTAGSA